MDVFVEIGLILVPKLSNSVLFNPLYFADVVPQNLLADEFRTVKLRFLEEKGLKGWNWDIGTGRNGKEKGLNSYFCSG